MHQKSTYIVSVHPQVNPEQAGFQNDHAVDLSRVRIDEVREKVRDLFVRQVATMPQMSVVSFSLKPFSKTELLATMEFVTPENKKVDPIGSANLEHKVQTGPFMQIYDVRVHPKHIQIRG